MSTTETSSSSLLFSPIIYSSSFDSNNYSSFVSPPSPTFSLYADSPDIWPPTMTDDSDNQSLLSHSSIDDASISGIIGDLSEQDFIDALRETENFNFDSKIFTQQNNCESKIIISNQENTRVNIETNHEFKFELAQPIIEANEITAMPVLTKTKKSSKRRSMTESVGSNDSTNDSGNNDSGEQPRKKSKKSGAKTEKLEIEISPVQAISCEPVNINNISSGRSVSSSSSNSDSSVVPLIDSNSLARVDVSLVTSLLAESQLKKNRLARKAELARLGRKAKNEQIEQLEEKIEILKMKLKQIKKSKQKETKNEKEIKIKIEENTNNSSFSLNESINQIESLELSTKNLIPRFLSFLMNQNEKFYSSINLRGLFTNLCQKQLKCDEKQKQEIIEIARKFRESNNNVSKNIGQLYENLRISLNKN